MVMCVTQAVVEVNQCYTYAHVCAYVWLILALCHLIDFAE